MKIEKKSVRVPMYAELAVVASKKRLGVLDTWALIQNTAGSVGNLGAYQFARMNVDLCDATRPRAANRQTDYR